MINSYLNLIQTGPHWGIGLALLRMSIGLLVLKNLMMYWIMHLDLFGVNSIFPYNAFEMNATFIGYSRLIPLFASDAAVTLIVFVYTAVSLLFTLGIGKRFTAVIFYILMLAFQWRNPYILDGSDNVMQVVLPFMLLSNAFSYFTFTLFDLSKLKSRLARQFPKISQAYKWYTPVLYNHAAIAIMIQVCYVYFFTAVAKHSGEMWENGTALYYVMRVSEFKATSFNEILTRNHYFVVVGTYLTMLWEISFAFLVWFRRTRMVVLLAGVLFHIGIWYFMRIDNFSWIMIATYFVFFSDKEYFALKGWLQSWQQKLGLTTFLQRAFYRGVPIQTSNQSVRQKSNIGAGDGAING